MSELLEFAKVFGATGAVCIVFAFITVKRCDRLDAKLDETNKYIQGDLMRANAHSAEVIAQNTAALENIGDHCGCPLKGQPATVAAKVLRG